MLCAGYANMTELTGPRHGKDQPQRSSPSPFEWRAFQAALDMAQAALSAKQSAYEVAVWLKTACSLPVKALAEASACAGARQ